MLSPQPKSRDTLAGNSLLIFLIRFFPVLANVLVVIAFSRLLPQNVYGSYQNFWVQLYLLGAIATIGLPAFILTYKPDLLRALSQKLKPTHYLFIILWIIATGSVFAWLRLENASLLFYVSLGLFCTQAFNAISESLLIAFRKFGLLFAVNVVYTLAFAWCHYLVLKQEFTLQTLFNYLLLTGGVRLLILGISGYRQLTQKVVINDNEYNLSDVRSLWMHIGFYDVLQKIFTWIDKFAISLLFTASVSAVYFNATYDIPFLPLLLGAVSGSALMQLASHVKKDDNSGAIYIANQTARILSSVVFPLFLFLFIFREELFTVVLTNKYIESVPIFAITVFIVPLRAYNFTTILQNRHKGKIINTGAVMDMLLALALMYPLYQWLGLLGIALSFVISSYIQGAYYLYHTASVLNTNIHAILPIKNWSLKLILFSLVFACAHYFATPLFSKTIVLALGVLLLVISAGVTLYIELKTTSKTNG